nr:signal peptidase I [Clostridium tarantellae]
MINENQYKLSKKSQTSKTLFFIIKFLVLSILMIFIINKFVIFIAYIPSGSMNPTLIEGDNLIISKIYTKINRGDIIVFNHESNENMLIKRVIGLPGDFIEIKKGKVYINNSLLEENYVKFPEDTNNIFKVPKDNYLFLGDNRKDSFDSRKWTYPYVCKKDIVGKAIFRFYPFNKIGFLK